MRFQRTLTPSNGLVSLIWIFLITVDNARGSTTDCTSLTVEVDGSTTLEIPANSDCVLSQDLGLSTLTVLGTMLVTSSNPFVTIDVNEIQIFAGGQISADAVVQEGSGKGNAVGSGVFPLTCSEDRLRYVETPGLRPHLTDETKQNCPKHRCTLVDRIAERYVRNYTCFY